MTDAEAIDYLLEVPPGEQLYKRGKGLDVADGFVLITYWTEPGDDGGFKACWHSWKTRYSTCQNWPFPTKRDALKEAKYQAGREADHYTGDWRVHIVHLKD